MSASDIMQVKVDNWGIYFLQRLKHFFNRTDYCDLTLQFQDNSRLKVHRLVLNACTEYFEILERSCEMYEDCLVMPDDLQADVVVPIVNFMYTGQLEFKPDLLYKLYQTAQVMNMTVLTKLLMSQLQPESVQAFKTVVPPKPVARKYEKSYYKPVKPPISKSKPVYQPTSQPKRSFIKAFDGEEVPNETPYKKPATVNVNYNKVKYKTQSPVFDPRPTRYELPEELDTDNIFEDNSFTNISYTSQPLMVHPETSKKYSVNKPSLFMEPSSSKGLSGTSTMDIIECPRLNHGFYDEDIDDNDFFSAPTTSEPAHQKDSSQLFDEILENSEVPKVTIEGPEQQANNIDHAKIISEVLKKYPHLMKSNKNIKLKILDSKNKSLTPTKEKVKIKKEVNDNTYEPVLDSKQAAKLISLGAENINGPWICLICGTPGKALHFTTYYKYRRHLVEVHKEKPVSTMCEHCGHKSNKRNYLLHHMYTKHGIDPPVPFHFPKCDECDYVALTESFLYRHKANHAAYHPRTMRCPECNCSFKTVILLRTHMKMNGHRYNSQKKNLSQCIYCNKCISHIYQHLKYHHADEAVADGVVVFSDDETENHDNIKVKQSESDNEEDQYEIIERPDGKIAYLPKKMATPDRKQKILNPGFKAAGTPITHKANNMLKLKKAPQINEVEQEIVLPVTKQTYVDDNVLIIDGKEYVIKNSNIVPRNPIEIVHEMQGTSENILPDILSSDIGDHMASTSMNFALNENVQHPRNIVFKKSNMNQPFQIVVSNEQEYKALMNPNQTVAYDGTFENKTLTVLTTAHNSSINNAPVELENTADNNLMIYQNNYPITTSDINNKNNFVVVYTQQPTSQNKQIQIMTSSNTILPQYIQPVQAPVSTYNTLTATGHLIDHSIQESNVPISEDQHLTVLLPEVEMQQEIIENITIPADNIQPTLEIEQVISEEHQSSQNITEYTENIINNQEPELETNETVILSEESCATISHINVAPPEASSEHTQEEFINSVPSEEGLIVQNNESECLEQIENDTVTPAEVTAHTDMSIDTSQEIAVSIEETVQETVEPQVIDTADVAEHKTPSNATHQLVSDWTDDEEETNGTEKESAEVEESIENIQFEVEKQINERQCESISLQEKEHIANEEIQTTNNNQVTNSVVAPPEKIASLLNDWDENDSQDEEPLQQGCEPLNENISQQELDSSKNGECEEHIVEHIAPVESVIEAAEADKETNIKKIVSDWDEEEDDEPASLDKAAIST